MWITVSWLYLYTSLHIPFWESGCGLRLSIFIPRLSFAYISPGELDSSWVYSLLTYYYFVEGLIWGISNLYFCSCDTWNFLHVFRVILSLCSPVIDKITKCGYSERRKCVQQKTHQQPKTQRKTWVFGIYPEAFSLATLSQYTYYLWNSIS